MPTRLPHSPQLPLPYLPHTRTNIHTIVYLLLPLGCLCGCRSCCICCFCCMFNFFKQYNFLLKLAMFSFALTCLLCSNTRKHTHTNKKLYLSARMCECVCVAAYMCLFISFLYNWDNAIKQRRRSAFLSPQTASLSSLSQNNASHGAYE